jgi:hypothetical protein
MVSGTGSKMVGFFVRPLRQITMRKLSREPRWDYEGSPVTSGWGAAIHPTMLDKAVDKFYEWLRHRGAYGTTKKAGEKRWS